MEAPEEPQAYPYPASPRAAAGARPASSVAAPPEPISYLHYAQKQLSPRSRMEYDLFNRIHFDRLHQVGTWSNAYALDTRAQRAS